MTSGEEAKAQQILELLETGMPKKGGKSVKKSNPCVEKKIGMDVWATARRIKKSILGGKLM